VLSIGVAPANEGIEQKVKFQIFRIKKPFGFLSSHKMQGQESFKEKKT
jgi:hypothetical protein